MTGCVYRESRIINILKEYECSLTREMHLTQLCVKSEMKEIYICATVQRDFLLLQKRVCETRELFSFKNKNVNPTLR